MDCELCSAELPDGGNFCSNCGAPRPEPASAEEETQPCRDCAQEVQVGAGFCWNCGARSPHAAPAVTGNTVVRKAPPNDQPSSDREFEWEQDAPGAAPAVGPMEPGDRTMRRGSGSPPLVPAEQTLPKSVRAGLPPGMDPAPSQTPAPTEEPPPTEDEPPTLPQKVVSMIAEELGEEPPTDPATTPPPPVPEDGSEPLSLEPDVDAAVAQAKKTPEPVQVSEEVAELQFLMLRGFLSEAEAAYQLLIEAHPGQPDLLALGEELAAKKAASSPAPAASGAGTPDVTVVSRAPSSAASDDDDDDDDDDDVPAPIETPSSPTFVEGTSPPPGGFAEAPAAPRTVAPKVTPTLGMHAPGGSHMPSSDSLPTNPRMPKLDIDTTAVSKPAGVRVVVLGPTGDAVWERTLALGEMLEVGRDPAHPWGDDPHIEPSHARLFVIPGGGLRVEPMGRSGVYCRVDERLAVRDGDEYRVGESLLRYSAEEGSWGTVTYYPLSGTACSSVPVGESGLLVGRENADIVLPEDTFVSGGHCRFSLHDERLYIEDIGSANGTYSRVRAGETVPYEALLLLGQTQFKVGRPAAG